MISFKGVLRKFSLQQVVQEEKGIYHHPKGDFMGVGDFDQCFGGADSKRARYHAFVLIQNI